MSGAIGLGYRDVAFLQGTTKEEMDRYFRDRELRRVLNKRLRDQAHGGNVVIVQHIPMPVYEEDMHTGETLLGDWKPRAPDWWVIQNRETVFHPQPEKDSLFRQWMLDIGRIIDWTVSSLFGGR